MKTKTMTSSVLLVIGAVVFSATAAQSSAQTANISATGAVSNSNGWISSVTLHNNASSSGGGGGTVYVVDFTGAAPGALSCNVTPATSGLNSRIGNPVSMPHVLVVTFTPSGPNGGAAGVATDFTLTCAVASSAPPAQATAPITTTTTTTTQTTSTTSPSPLLGTQTASISSIAGVTNNNGWINSVTFTGVTGYPPNAYIVEFAGKSPGAANCQASPATAIINGYTFTPGIFDESDGTSIMVRYAPPQNVPGGATIPAAQAFTLTCSLPSS
jgi:hypothetical protein